MTIAVTRSLLGATCVLVVAASIAKGQAPVREGPIGGTVVGARSEPIAGARVTFAGTTRAAETDNAGHFRVPSLVGTNITLEVTKLGYRKVSHTAAVGDTTIRITMAQSAVSLDAIVVTGTTGAQEKRTIGNAVSSLPAATLVETAPIRSVGDLLNGRVAGVTVMPSTGVVGGGPRIQIRGRSTISLQLEPLIYVDGVRTNNDVGTGPSGAPPVASRLGDLNPEEIESIEVIRGPAAATLYGTEASNGVVQIITKKGRRAEKPSYSFSMRQGANWFMDPEGRIQHNFGRDPATAQIIEQDLLAQERAAGRPIFRTGTAQGYDLGMGGGTGLIRYYLSGGYDNDKGIQPTDMFSRQSARANLAIAPSTKFDVGANLGIIRAHRDLSLDRGLSLMFALIWGNPALKNTPYRGFVQGPPEVWWTAFKNYQDVDRYIAGVQFNHRPFSWLTQKLNVGTDQTAEDNEYIVELPTTFIAQFLGALDRGGRKVVTRRDRNLGTFDYGLTANRTLTSRLKSTTSFGAQYYKDYTGSQYSEGRGFPVGGIKLVSGAAQTFGGDDFLTNATVGVYGQEQVSLNDRLFLTAALRKDGNSAFGKDAKYATYPKVSASWVVSEEPRFKLGFVDELRVRAAYGQSGLQPRAFAALQTYQPQTGGSGATVSPLSLGNPKLGPERGEEVEVGFETGLLKSRLGLEFTYYDKRTKDMILLRTVAPSTGFPQAQFINAGQVKNNGIEMLINAVPFQAQKVTWNTTFSFSTNDSKIIDLDPKNPSLTFISILRPPQAEIRNAEGYPIGSRFAKKIVSATFNATTGRAENIMCDSGGGAAPLACDVAPSIFIGRTTPKYEGGFSNDVTFLERFTFHTQIDFKGGHVKFDQDSQGRCVLFSLCEVNYRPEKFDPIDVAYAQTGGVVAAKWLPDASFTKLREVALSYDLPKSWLRYIRTGEASKASIRIAGRNLHTWTKYTSLDPESLDIGAIGTFASYYEQTTTPQLAQFVTTLRVTW